MRKNNITEIEGHGRFTDPHKFHIDLREGGSKLLSFDHAVIATGSRVRMLSGVTLSDNIVTYEQQILSADLPESIVIIGAGAIGMEFAYILHSYGVRVEILEFADLFFPTRTPKFPGNFSGTTGAAGWRFTHPPGWTKSSTTASTSSSATPALTERPPLRRPPGASTRIGFVPNAQRIGLDAAGVRVTATGAVDIDDYMRTSAPHIYAIGDVTAKVQLAHVASAQGVVAAETIAGVETMPLDYPMMPRVTFCQPQVASFGYTEEQARAAGHRLRVATFPMQASAKAHGLGERGGFIKMVADDTHGELLGAHLVGSEVSELLPELTLAQLWDLTATELARNVHTHPTLGEGLQECFHALVGKAVNL